MSGGVRRTRRAPPSRSGRGSVGNVPQIIAHRGASATYPEHTRAAYVEALAQGADGLECDVQLTADGRVVLWHDATLERTSDASGPLHERTWAEVRALDAWSWKGVGAPPPSHGAPSDQVLSLEAFARLAIAAGRPVLLVIELKHPSPWGRALEDAVLDALGPFGLDPSTGRLGTTQVSATFMSFDPGSQRYLAQRVAPALCMLLVDDVSDSALVGDLSPGAEPDPAVVAHLRSAVAEGLTDVASGAVGGLGPSVAWCRTHPERVREAVASGTTVRVWTVDDAVDARYLVSLGVGGLTTNRPAALRAELGPR